MITEPPIELDDSDTESESDLMVNGNIELNVDPVAQQMLDEENEPIILDDLQLSFDSTPSEREQPNGKTNAIDDGDDDGDDVVYIVIDDDDEDSNDIESANGDGDDAYTIHGDNNVDVDDTINELSNSPIPDKPPDGGYKCPLCVSCYSTIEFLQMHLSNYHSTSTIHSFLSTSGQKTVRVRPIPISKRIEDLPTENILIDDTPDTAEYAQYLFGYEFEKTSTGQSKCPKCDFTGLKFKTINHVFSHTNRRLFSCMVCYRRYGTLAHARSHMRKLHSY